jgi:asparagine synthase (glutamine-hydrolysing)
MGAVAITAPAEALPASETVRRMLLAAPHRGNEIQIDVVGRAAFGVANDPELRDAWLARANGRIAAFAGMLDNLHDLTVDLGRISGTPLANANPADIVLAAFAAWGEGAPSHFRGVFSGAVADEERVWCFRDHLGFKPFFYREDTRGFFAATEAKQVVAGAGISREPDLEGIQGILFGGPRHLGIRGVERFPSSSTGTVDRSGRVRITRYWDPESLLETARLSPDETIERLRELMDQAVSRTVSGNDVVALSGGIDSPVVAAFAAPRHAELSGRPLQALSAVFPHLPSVDELPYIELVRERLNIPLQTYVPTSRPLDRADFWADLLDGPVDTLSIPEVAEISARTRELGARRLLTGELFEYLICMRQHVIAHLILHGRWRSAGARLAEERARGLSWSSVLRPHAVALLPPILATRYVRLRNRDHADLPPWLERGRVSGLGYRRDLQYPARRRWLEAQLAPTGRGGSSSTIEANEICSAYHGIQPRTPLTDIDLWEFCLSLRAETKFPNRVLKVLVRHAMKDLLPEEILWRKDKTGFDAHVMATAEWDEIRRWTIDSPHRIAGIDYTALDARLQSRAMDSFELGRARDLARAHAFLSLWD